MSMRLFTQDDLVFAHAVSNLATCNPFLPDRIHFERIALGREFVPGDPVWSYRPDVWIEPPNLVKLGRRAEEVVSRVRERILKDPAGADRGDLAVYEDLVHYVLFHRNRERFFDLLVAPGTGRGRISFHEEFAEDAARFLKIEGLRGLPPLDASHLFACAWQIRRAFHHVFTLIVGGSMPAARLRAAVWQSVFTHDMRRYRRSLFATMGEFTTLVTGASGTGKELVARAIAWSRYIPFDSRSGAFREGFSESMHPLNLSALSPTLIESELFGHRRGSFTGAIADRPGWLETCSDLGTVFLDEIGELDGALQVKLLRVLQDRVFHRIGETETRRFRGKVVAATNRDLEREMASGRFRTDLYYRLCSDVIRTPSLSEILADAPAELGNFVRLIARRFAGPDAEAVASEAEKWIRANLGKSYGWPGNVRELEQCVANFLIRREYRPATRADKGSLSLSKGVEEGSFTADELLSRYCTLVYSKAGSYEEAARRLGMDRRTVKARVDEKLLEELRGKV
ncbi:MAG: sigma 54-interacting transcriptional regulator [Planctomycetes bacterium]|nr:sigma 54-interacting transcriptional regulator [Planctomycetota bacterium]